MATLRLKNIERRIENLLQRLAEVGDMRPGTLSVQYRKPAEKKKPFHQISYTHKGKSRSEYVRPENLESIRKEVEAYRRFRSMIQEITELSIQASRIRSNRRNAPSSKNDT
jgi:hypothetical protein